VTVAKGLNVKVVSAGNAAPNLDQMVFWPASHPTHIIAINEEGSAEPSLQKINLETGVATTIVTGTDSGDPIPSPLGAPSSSARRPETPARCTS
jgi:hypothetical protein